MALCVCQLCSLSYSKKIKGCLLALKLLHRSTYHNRDNVATEMYIQGYLLWCI